MGHPRMRSCKVDSTALSHPAVACQNTKTTATATNTNSNKKMRGDLKALRMFLSVTKLMSTLFCVLGIRLSWNIRWYWRRPRRAVDCGV